MSVYQQGCGTYHDGLLTTQKYPGNCCKDHHRGLPYSINPHTLPLEEGR